MKLNYTTYLSHTLIVFISCLFLGIYINQIFYKYQRSLEKPNIILLSFLQLFTIISMSYFIYTHNSLHPYFESYSPSLLLSTFLFSLQSNMITNFNQILSNYI